jgi:DNA-binding NarL/FixJ family response regulator
VRVLLADDHSRVRWALRTAIREEPGLVVVGEVTQAEDLLAQVHTLRPDILLLEWELSGGIAGELLRALCGLDSGPQVIILGQQPASRAAALAAGADAFVSKADGPDQLLATLRALAPA